jgi:hypothetical protein
LLRPSLSPDRVCYGRVMVRKLMKVRLSFPVMFGPAPAAVQAERNAEGPR